jgi:hypothetical protein
VNQEPAKDVRHGGRHRRFPHRTAADVDVLDSLLPAAAREFDRLLRQQHDDERRRQLHEAEVGDRALEAHHAHTASRWSHGAGGGKRVRPEGAGPDA